MWHKDSGAEQLMRDLGIDFEFKPGYLIKDLNIRDSLQNNARVGSPLDEDRVEKYAYDMKRGIAFPAPVITTKGIILAGNQRTNAAMRAGRTTIDVYVISASTSLEKIDDFIRRDNTRHGKPISDEDKIQTCVELHRKYKRPLRELNAQYFGENEKMYSRLVLANQAKAVEERLLERNVIHGGRLPMSTLATMHPIQDINVLRDTARLALDYNLSQGQVDEVVKEISSKNSESDRASVVRQKKGEFETRVKKGVVLPEVQLKKQVTSFLKFLDAGTEGKPFPSIESIADKEQRSELKTAVDSIISHLKKLKEKAR